MRISDWSSDVCSSDLLFVVGPLRRQRRGRCVLTLRARLCRAGDWITCRNCGSCLRMSKRADKDQRDDRSYGEMPTLKAPNVGLENPDESRQENDRKKS